MLAITAIGGKIIQTLRSYVLRITQAGETVAKEYQQLMQNNAQYIASGNEAQHLERKLVMTRLSALPGHWHTAKQEADALRATLRRGANDITVGEAGTYAAFVLEAYGWFCLGEALGRGSLVGYT